MHQGICQKNQIALQHGYGDPELEISNFAKIYEVSLDFSQFTSQQQQLRCPHFQSYETRKAASYYSQEVFLLNFWQLRIIVIVTFCLCFRFRRKWLTAARCQMSDGICKVSSPKYYKHWQKSLEI
jgi:hypothetical protein